MSKLIDLEGQTVLSNPRLSDILSELRITQLRVHELETQMRLLSELVFRLQDASKPVV